jgi:hypothetical protein
MELDAHVFCNYLEHDSLRSAPQPEWDVFVAEDGSRETRAGDPQTQLEFGQWNRANACEHEDGLTDIITLATLPSFHFCV